METAEAVDADEKVVAAWQEYLHATKDVHPIPYREVEEWAWERLQQRLRRSGSSSRSRKSR